MRFPLDPLICISVAVISTETPAGSLTGCFPIRDIKFELKVFKVYHSRTPHREVLRLLQESVPHIL